MKMEILSELPVPSSDQTIIIKRKRTKRHHRPSSPADEDEDMAANCLILLASSANDKFTDMPSRVGIYVYECKTCNRTFPSFQALGGHRASHKRPRLLHEQLMLTPPPNKVGTKIHECSICGSEFGSGQALGGHMRRHRPPTILEKPRNLLALDLDLNLPPPPDVDDGKYNQQPRMVFSAAALVDCHY